MPTPTLLACLSRLAALQRDNVDRLALQEAVAAASDNAGDNASTGDPVVALAIVTQHLQLRAARWRTHPDAADLPALIANNSGQWRVLRGQTASGQWLTEDFNGQQWQESPLGDLGNWRVANLRLQPPYRASQSPVLRLIIDELLTHKGLLAEAAVGGLLLAFFGILVSFYSMQVYDRVIPAGATQTLLVLTLGIVLAICLEWAARHFRSRLYERLIDQVDQRLARHVYLRFLAIRIDQLPASVGGLAAQLRGYESVRGFLVAVTSQLLVDAPFALIFVIIIAAIAGPLALIPFLFFAVALTVGLMQAGRVQALTSRSHASANFKTGLLVETIEAAEIIKSSQGGWRMLGRWLTSADEARDIDLSMRRIAEHSQHLAAALQQASYVALIAIGALLVSRGELTMGGLLACSILSGRILGPVVMAASQLVAWGQTKAALQGLDAIWKLEDDHHGESSPVQLEQVRGDYRLEDIDMKLAGKSALVVKQLQIRPGEKIGVLGPVGAGKTTLLRLLSGMYKPQAGRVWLDGIDLAQIAKPLLAEHIGYLPQEGRLLAGTLRDNLVLGILDPGDEAILAAARLTGLFDAVIATHPKGLDQAIFEGGSGLSGGQRQLVNATRVFLRRPHIWLLDEPTAHLDRAAELRLISALESSVCSDDTLILVTHKPEMLQRVERILVIANQQVLLDGPRDAVLARLQTGISLDAGNKSPGVSR
jgi:ATP-binding cassette subfamily C protein LapB